MMILDVLPISSINDNWTNAYSTCLVDFFRSKICWGRLPSKESESEWQNVGVECYFFSLHFDISCFLNLNYYFDEIARVKRFYHVRLLKTHQYQVAFRPEFGSNLLSENWFTKKTERFLHVVGMSFSVCLTELSATALEYIINYCIFFL